MCWRRQIEALLCAVFLLLGMVAMVAVKTLATIGDSLGSVPSDQSNFSSQTKEPASPAERFEIETPWDKGSLWDDEAPAYDLSQAPATSEIPTR